MSKIKILTIIGARPQIIKAATLSRIIKTKYFSQVDVLGISANTKVIEYYNQNLESVKRFKTLDIFNLEKNLPNFIYKIPYEFLNRVNRNNLQSNDNELVSAITYKDYELVKDDPNNLDLFVLLKKK